MLQQALLLCVWVFVPGSFVVPSCHLVGAPLAFQIVDGIIQLTSSTVTAAVVASKRQCYWLRPLGNKQLDTPSKREEHLC